MMRKLVSITTLLSLLISSSLCYADTATTSNTKWYQVNVVAFKQASIEHLQPQRIEIPFTAKMWSNVTELNKVDPNTSQPNTPFQLLPISDSNLRKEVKQISKDKDYIILMNESWLQSINPDDKAVTIHLYGGQALNFQGKPVETDNTSFADLETNQNPWAMITNYELNGTMKIYVKRYFNVHLNLHLNEPFAENETPLYSQPTKTFSMVQNRRMRSNELNYFDNPAFGVIVKIVRVKT